MSSENIRILLIEDNPGDARLILETLKDVRNVEISVEWVDELKKGIDLISGNRFDVLLLDLGLPDSEGYDTFVRAKEAAPGTPIILVTGLDDEMLAVKAVQNGAQDYLVKGEVDEKLLIKAVRYAIERKKAQEELLFAQQFARNMIDSSIDMIVAIDNSGRISEFNSAAEDGFGYSADEVLGDELETLDADAMATTSMVETVLECGVCVKELESVRKSGETFTRLVSASILTLPRPGDP